MIFPPSIIYFIPAALVLLLLPGSAVIYIVTRSLSEGKRTGLVSVLGVQLADLTHAFLATAGLSAILLASALAFDLVKFLGAGYLIYLGLHTILTKRSEDETKDQLSATPRKKLSRVLANGFLVDLLNPKTALFFYAFLPQFVIPSAGSVTEQILLFGIVFVLLGSCTDTSYAILGSTTKSFLSRTKLVQKRGRYLTGGTYIALGIAAATSANLEK